MPSGAPMRSAPPATRRVPESRGRRPNRGFIPFGAHLVPVIKSRMLTAGFKKKLSSIPLLKDLLAFS